MLHEILLGLCTAPAELADAEEKAVQDWINRVDTGDFLHPTERAIFRELSIIGANHYKIQKFILPILQGETSDGSIQTDPYLYAFCTSINSAMNDYKSDLVQLEQTLLQNPNLTLTYVRSQLVKYDLLFVALKCLIHRIQEEQIHGCLFLGTVQRLYESKFNAVLEASKKIQVSVNYIFFKDLCNWVLSGNVTSDEFFIGDAKCADEGFSQPDTAEPSTAGKSHSKPSIYVRKFFLKKEMLPSVLSLSLGQTILFIGRLVWIMRNESGDGRSDLIKFKKRRDVWSGNQLIYAQKFCDLESEPFDPKAFESAIEDCRLCLTKYLWVVVVDEAKLLDHLQMMREYFCLGRGELFQHFITASDVQLKNIPPAYLVTKMNNTFKATAKEMYPGNDKTYEKFKLTLSNSDEMLTGRSLWFSLKMDFDVDWPLHILFHPAAMSLYNKLFSFLLRVKGCNISLTRLWSKRNLHPSAFSLRNTLLFIVSNLEYYLQVDVIESQFSLLKKAVKAASRIEDIIRVHSEFLGQLMSGAFLFAVKETSSPEAGHDICQVPELNYDGCNQVSALLTLLFELCDQFCSEVNDLEEEFNAEHLRQKCDALMENLFTMLFLLKKHNFGEHLSELMHHIDFNRWFTKHNQMLSTSFIES